MGNLALICEHHHLLVHEGGWQLRRDDEGWLAVAPGGRVVGAAPTCGGSGTELPSAHGAQLTPTTVTGSWAGEPLHLAYAVAVHATPRPT